MIVSLIVAYGNNQEIGRENRLLWSLSEDLKNFKRITMGATLLMGRKTYESIGRPLPGRETIVMTRQEDWDKPCLARVHSFDEALDICHKKGERELIVCGGGEIYETALPYVQKIYLSEVDWTEPKADTYFPKLNFDEWVVAKNEAHPATQKTPAWTFKILERKES